MTARQLVFLALLAILLAPTLWTAFGHDPERLELGHAPDHVAAHKVGTKPFDHVPSVDPGDMRVKAQSVKRPQRVVLGAGACGGPLPPCSVLDCESGGNLVAQNPTSSASGKWQILDSTWRGYGGFARAMDAPEAVQDEKARLLWADGAGAFHWRSCL